VPHRRYAFGYRWPMEGHDIVASLGRPDAYQRITPQHTGNHRENVDSPSPRVDAGWNTDPAAGKGRSTLRTLLHLELRADTSAHNAWAVHKTVATTLLLFAVGSSSCNRSRVSASSVEGQIGYAIEERCPKTSDCPIRLRDVTSFDWDKMFYFDYAVPPAEREKAVGVQLETEEFRRPLVFLRGGMGVSSGTTCCLRTSKDQLRMKSCLRLKSRRIGSLVITRLVSQRHEAMAEPASFFSN
jgi:hypothetical protein